MNLLKFFSSGDPLAVSSVVRRNARISYSLDITLDLSRINVSLDHKTVIDAIKRVISPPLEIRSLICYLLTSIRTFRVIKGETRTVGVKWDLSKLTVPTDFPERFDKRWIVHREGILPGFDRPIMYKVHICIEPGPGGTAPDFKILSLMSEEERRSNFTQRDRGWVFN
uniref:Putative matrix protein n=1 Tax=Oak-Vale virus TaxID=318852 RepID=G1BWF7_9RHAB|nr:putative matrix protein [Oak-Vale virus]